ncbi:hypothetical protein TIFTF001_015660 [Ficus carica]|uniref:Uncharacterized protein n=1 Tax=Ficus carica TaxID=3494 RepID=A0AA88AI46_FICCA|nr:hypothetical protein TIFTF001_015660 [Ficus carica]
MGEEGGRSRAVQLGNRETKGNLQGRVLHSKPISVYCATVQWKVQTGLNPQTGPFQFELLYTSLSWCTKHSLKY